VDGYGNYLSSDNTTNPQMYNWNKVVMRYCDGASFAGSNSSTAEYNGTTLHFRGKHILDAFIADLLGNRGLAKATDLVVAGCSAGGLATFLHADRWAAAMPAGMAVAATPDSWFFLDYESPASAGPPRVHMWRDVPIPGGEWERVRVGLADAVGGMYQSDMQWVFTQQNVTSGVDQDCIAAYPPDQQWHCMFAEHTSPFIRTRIFPLQSEYDAWQIEAELPNNSTAMVNELGVNITSRLQANLLNRPQNGVFLDSCVHHCWMWSGLRINGSRQADAFQLWYESPGEQQLFIQGQAYPCADCCRATDGNATSHP